LQEHVATRRKPKMVATQERRFCGRISKMQRGVEEARPGETAPTTRD